MFHYNKHSTTYGVARDTVPLFQDEEIVPPQRARHLHPRQALHVSDHARLRSHRGHRHRKLCPRVYNPRDGTKIYRFSKELLAYIEMCVAFSQHYRQNDPHTASAMDMYLRDALQTYADVTYKDLHDYLARRFHAWYTKFKPSSSAVVSAGDSELGAVVQVEGVDAAAPTAKKVEETPIQRHYSLTLNDVSASPCAAPAAACPADPAAADEGGEYAAHKESSGQCIPH
jgi:hypothetical protein